MPPWCSSSDGQAAKGEIELEGKTRGWDLLSRASSKDQLTIGEAQRRKFITHLERQYPAAQKDTAAWLKFIKKTTGQAKQWKSASTAYTQAANQTHNPTTHLHTRKFARDARLKRKDGARLSQDDRTAQGLDLTPAEEKLLARQDNVLCVCAHVMAVVCSWVQVLIGNCAHWMHGVSFTHLQWVATGWMHKTE